MQKYSRRDVKKLQKFLKELTPPKPDNSLVSITKLGNMLYRLGFLEHSQSGSKRPYSHELLKDHLPLGRFLMTEAHGKRGQMHYRNFVDYCLPSIELFLQIIEIEKLIIEDEYNV